MTFLVDTHLLIWAADNADFVSLAARKLLDDEANELFFSVISIWEVAIRYGLKQDGFTINPRALRRGLIGNGYIELLFTSEHTFALKALPPIHKDPFGRALIVQATSEGIFLLTANPVMEGYSRVVRRV